MKTNQFYTITILLFLITSCGTSAQNELSYAVTSDTILLKELFSFSENQDFFNLKSKYAQNKEKLSEEDALYFKAIVENAFNNPKESNISINKISELDHSTLKDSLIKDLYLLKVLNHTRLYEYELAAEAGEFLLKNYSNLFDSSSIADLENTNKIWISLKDAPKQEVIRNKDVTIPMSRDIAGLYNISTTFSDTSLDFVIDTGADFSTIRRSLVNKLGLKLIKSDFMVGGSTETKVKSDLAIAESFNIGGVTIKNAVFLVLEDEALSWPGYDIYAIIGYPVIEAMKEIHFKEDEIFIPKKSTPYSNNNFALGGFKPIVSAKHKGDNLLFTFDTGADATSLYSKYFKKYQNYIESNYKKETLSDGSVGGFVAYEGYTISKFKLAIDESEAEMDSLELHIENIGETESNFHGNLGQDFIKQFDKMIISFEYSSIVFE